MTNPRQGKELKPPMVFHWNKFSWGSMPYVTKEQRQKIRFLIKTWFEEGQVVGVHKDNERYLTVYHRFPTLEDYL